VSSVKILITGASGNVGRYLSDELSNEHTVIALSRSAPNQTHTYTHIVHDLMSDTDKLDAVFTDWVPDAVIHLAAILGGSCETNPELARSLNTDITHRLAQLSTKHHVNKFIFFSTAAVYHQVDLSPTDEVSNIEPRSVYGQTKLQAEDAIQNIAAKSRATQFITFRPFQIYGDSFEKSLVHMLARSTPQNSVHLISYKNLYRDYIHISEVARAVSLALANDFQNPHTIMNLASGMARSNADLVYELEQNGIHPSYTLGENDKLDVLWADISKLRSVLGFQPSSTLIAPR
jgi:UDP-glucose 4-epimerase